MRKFIGIAVLLIALVFAAFVVTNATTSLLRSDQGGTGADNSAAVNNKFAKWLSGTPATLTSATCTESGGVIANCTAPAVAHNLLSATHGDTNSGAAAPVKGDLAIANNGAPNKWDKLGVGTDDFSPMADATQALGVRYGRQSGFFMQPKTVNGSTPATYGMAVAGGVVPAALTQLAITTGFLYAMPLAMSHTGVVSGIEVLVSLTSATTANCRVGVYGPISETDPWPSGAPVYAESANRDLSTAGACAGASAVTPCNNAVATSPTFTLSVGKIYWAALFCSISGGSLTLKHIPEAATWSPLGYTTGGLGTYFNAFKATAASPPTIPSPWPVGITSPSELAGVPWIAFEFTS